MFEDGIIEQTLLNNDRLEDKMKRISTWICDTRDKDVVESLIKLGWTPPKDDFVTT